AFAETMTRQARLLGMNDTVFRNASGLPDLEQKTTARDMATMSRAMIQRFPAYYHYLSEDSFTYGGRVYVGHNHLLKRYEGAAAPAPKPAAALIIALGAIAPAAANEPPAPVASAPAAPAVDAPAAPAVASAAPILALGEAVIAPAAPIAVATVAADKPARPVAPPAPAKPVLVASAAPDPAP